MDLGFSNDSFFFKIECPDLVGNTTTNEFINRDIISFSITEEMGRLANGSLTLRDSGHVYSSMFRAGMRFNISWGYKKWNQNISDIDINTSNQLTVGSKRKGIHCIVTGRSGAGSEGGQNLLNVSFYSVDIMAPKQHKIYTAGTYADVVAQAMFDLGIDIQYINFDLANTPVDSLEGIRQWESSFNFLLKLSREWKSLFTVGFMANGQKAGVFVSNNKMNGAEVQAYIKSIYTFAGASTSTKNFYFNSGTFSNVKNYSWQENIGDSGQGDNVQIQMVNGVAQFRRYKAETGKVVTYRLNADRVKDQIDKSSDKLGLAFSENFLGAKDFSQVQWAFDAVEETTAPDGIGLTINLALIGDPLITPAMQGNFIGDFPAPLTQNRVPGTGILFWLRKVSHTLTKDGYNSDVEVVDGYTLLGTYLQDTGIRQ